jgi:DNA modification methylase
MKKIPPGPVAEAVGKVMLELSTSNWHGCYDDSWQGLIVPEAFAHPAKFSHGLICRIVEHGLAKGYWKAGDTVADPFGGVALGGIICGYHGLNWTGIELEVRFCELGNRNLDLHRAKWKALGYDVDVQLVQGDSRNLAKIVQQDEAVVCSPPFSDQLPSHDNFMPPHDTGQRLNTDYDTAYGSTPGQVGRLKAGSVEAILTSPPYAGTRQDGTIKDGGGFSSYSDGPTTKWHTERNPANIGNLGDETNVNRETYWQAVAAIYEQCHQILKPGGVMVCVVKSYVKNKAIVPLPDDTLKLLGHIGFEPVERIHAMLVKESTERTFFGEVTKTNSRKSFFRRLCESKGSPKIDWEEVLFVRKSVTENKNIYYHEKRIVASGP